MGGMEIYSEYAVSYVDAILGSTLKVPTVDGVIDLQMPAHPARHHAAGRGQGRAQAQQRQRARQPLRQSEGGNPPEDLQQGARAGAAAQGGHEVSTHST